MPWLKTLSLDGTATRSELPAAGGRLELESRRRKPNPAGFPQPKTSRHIVGVDGAWFGDASASVMSGVYPDPRGARVRLEHGAALAAGARAYVYLDRVEHRDGDLEAAACSSADQLEAWASWLELRADPYAVPLRRMMSGHEYGPGRERWWLEGIDRGMASIGADFVMRDGFLREADLRHGKLAPDMLIVHLLSLRVARGLERLSLAVPHFLAASSWRAFGASAFWGEIRWPSSFRQLHLACGGRSLEARTMAEEIARALPTVEVTC